MTAPPEIRLHLNYVGRRWRTWYIVVLGSVAAITYDSVWAGIFVLLATVDVDERRAARGTR
jgi:hypothetical protein